MNPAILHHSSMRDLLDAALAKRDGMHPHETNALRLIDGAGDGLNGLCLETYADRWLLATPHDQPIHPQVLDWLNDRSASCYLKSLDPHHKSSPSRLLGPEITQPFLIREHGASYEISFQSGYSQGIFLDQRDNRISLASLAKGATVLDCFCNEGGFGMHAAAAGATNVDFVDAQAECITKAKVNATLNKLTNVHFEKADAFEFLANAVKEKKTYDIVVLDPPSFTKSKKTLATALKGYKEINANGIRLVAPGGFLATASCSQHVDETMFLSMINESASKTGRAAQVVSISGAAGDHPTLPSMPETKYLKYALVRVY